MAHRYVSNTYLCVCGSRARRASATGQHEAFFENASEAAILRTCMDSIGECFQHCLTEGGKHVEADHLRYMLDAWDLLNVTATLMARDSPHAKEVEAICAQAVKDCEESCEDFDDERMVACADICRETYAHLAA
jgi:hypothetical protein